MVCWLSAPCPPWSVAEVSTRTLNILLSAAPFTVTVPVMAASVFKFFNKDAFLWNIYPVCDSPVPGIFHRPLKIFGCFHGAVISHFFDLTHSFETAVLIQ